MDKSPEPGQDTSPTQTTYLSCAKEASFCVGYIYTIAIVVVVVVVIASIVIIAVIVCPIVISTTVATGRKNKELPKCSHADTAKPGSL